MALSGSRWRRRAAAVMTAGMLVLVGAACGADDDDAPVVPVVPTIDTVARLPIDVPLGKPIVVSEAAHFLPMTYEGRQVQPVAAYESRFVVAEWDSAPEENGAPQQFVLWDPATGARTAAWSSQPGRQDVVTGIDGDSAVYVRLGLTLPFADWSIRAVDLATGEEREIAAAQPGVEAAAGVNPGPPFGLAPYPAVHAGRVAWVEYVLRDGAAWREVRVHELGSGETRTVARAEAMAGEDVGSATLGGSRAAWVRWTGNGGAAIELLEIDSSTTRTLAVEAQPFAVALDGSGEMLAWDDAHGGKYAIPLSGGTPFRFAGDEGWGVTVAGSRFAWAPAAAYGGTGGFYDLSTNELRLVERKPRVQVNQASLLGDWFTWQELHADEDGGRDMAASGYYFLALGS